MLEIKSKGWWDKWDLIFEIKKLTYKKIIPLEDCENVTLEIMEQNIWQTLFATENALDWEIVNQKDIPKNQKERDELSYWISLNNF